ncbi:sulfotransferase family protein [Litoreibacter meonggei]|uniref:Sulfotransferase family protein n=1 Tax=Litoreibacter meonggei TaxID=1049199 RepID=A0A497UYH4_9RHOB|nr:sulfotransferase [Litoreibacter meonggei]RLJ36221.1 sulfotransferase family protein [Litoreibacter meonggei]
MTPFLINIGYPKTATSFLQKLVFTNTRIFTQPWGSMPTQAIEQFALAHPRRFDAATTRAIFTDQLDKDDTRVPVISHESLSGNPFYAQYHMDIVARRMHAAFPEARILIGIREQRSMLRSIYFQYVREGGGQSLTEVLQTNLGRTGYRPPLRMEHFEYDLTIRHYARLFGAENILVLPVEQLKYDTSAYIASLASFLGADWKEPVPEDVVYGSRPETAMRLERVVNRILPKPAVRPKTYSRNPLWFRIRQNLLRKVEKPLARLEARAPRASAIDTEIEAFIGESFAASNARTAAMTGLDLTALGYPVTSDPPV